MRRHPVRWREPLFLVLLACCSRSIDAQSPNGFIQSPQWACLLPLDGNDCTGGGERAMLENWVAPHSVATESPVLGTVWDDIDFGGAARSRGYLGSSLPRFITLGPREDPDIVDFGAYLKANDLPFNFVLAVAVTYVENTTEKPLWVEVCASSDDSIQVWVNGAVVLNRSVCRSLPPDCAELSPAVLAPGVNRLTALIWQGYGDFAFRLGLSRPNGRRYTDEDQEVKCLGARSSDGVVGPIPQLTRSWEGSAFLCPDLPQEVAIRGDGTFQADTIYGVCEEIWGAVSTASVNGVSGDGSVGWIDDELRAVGDFFRAVVGVPCSWDNSTYCDDDPCVLYTTRATTGRDIWSNGDVFEYALQYAEGDFDFAVEIVEKRFPSQGRWGKFGLMVRQTLDPTSRFGMIEDCGPDLTDPARYARRTRHLVAGAVEEPATTEGLVDPNTPLLLNHPRFLRLTRRGNTVAGWVSETAGNGDHDPKDDANWALVYEDEWAGTLPALYLGFAYSVHESSGCRTGEIVWWPLYFDATVVSIRPPGVRVCWEATGAVLDGEGLRYTVAAHRGSTLSLTGRTESSEVQGPRAMSFHSRAHGPLGLFEESHDVGLLGPCTPGSLRVDSQETDDPADDTYALAASGLDIWSEGDQFSFAHRALTGDFDFQVHFRVDEIEPPRSGGRWGKFGLMARWDSRPNAAYFFVHNAAATRGTCEVDAPRIAFRPKGGFDSGNDEANKVWWQDVFGSEPIAPQAPTCPMPNEDPRLNDLRGDRRNMAPYLRMVRRDNTFYGYGSDDGRDWKALGAYSWNDPPASILVGVAATSHADCETLTVAFDGVRFGMPSPIAESVKDPPSDGAGVLATSDFEDDPEGSCPASWICNSWSGEQGRKFRPQVVDGWLRLADRRRSPLGDGASTSTTAFFRQSIDTSGAYLFDFDVRFRYDQAAAGDGNPPADGLTFCMLGTRTGADLLEFRVGDSGSDLGYSRINMSRNERALRSKEISLNSVAVELDVWHSGEVWNEGDGANVSGWDPRGGLSKTGSGPYHVGLDVNASVASAQRNADLGVRDEDLPDLFDPRGIHFRVLYDHGRVRAWTRPNGEGGGGDFFLVLDDKVEPLEVNSPQALVGFTAGTGDATCTMEVDNFVVSDPLHRGFHRGDANEDGILNISDAIYVLSFLFSGGMRPPCTEAANANDDSTVDITDGIFVLNFLFLGGPPPSMPGPPARPCGPDPKGSPSDLGCDQYRKC